MISIVQAAGWPIWLLIACSVLAVALIVERFVSLRRAGTFSPQLVEEAINVSRTGVPDAETIRQLENYSLLGNTLAAGWHALADNAACSPSDLRAAIEAAGRSAAQQLNRYLPALGTIVSAAPLLGLFGTVIGMIEIFGSQASTGSLAGGNPAQLAHGISVALYNTAFGIIIAVPTLFFWQYFRTRANAGVTELEAAGERFARHLERFCREPKGDPRR